MERNIMPYTYSPTGKAYIGHFKEPFKPIVGGYGFQGVLLQDSDRKTVQCAGCGGWYSFLGHHIRTCLKITVREYKEKYGLNYTTGLISDELAKIRRDSYYKNIDKVRLDGSQKPTPMKGVPKPTNYTEKENKFGTCPLQLLTRVVNFIKTNEVIPSSRNRGKNLYAVVNRKYGGFPKALKSWGLPFYSGHGSSFEYTFPDKTSYTLNVKKKESRSHLYRLMLEKCPILKEEDLNKYAVDPLRGKAVNFTSSIESTNERSVVFK